MFCVSTVSYAVLINNQEHGLISPHRGLRQGDPMSPALFALCTEGLSHLLAKAEMEGGISGVRFSTQGPSISHLLFADDSLFMCKPDIRQVIALQGILKTYGEGTGQVINLQKPSLTFGKGIPEEIRTSIRESFGIFNEGGAGTYLGLPECFSGSKIEMFNYIKIKLKKRLPGWFARYLSLGGKEVLLKAAALAFHVYAMSCFKLPKTTIVNLTSAMATFWWHTVEHKRKIHWVRWEKMCLPKDLGGLGFKSLESFNQALLAKQAWKLLQNPNSLITRLLKSRYFDSNAFLEAKMSKRLSFGWRSLMYGRDLLVKGLRKEIGNGKSLYVWTDPWCDFGGRWNPWMMNRIINLDMKVSELINQETGDWRRDVLEANFFPGDVDIILKKKTVVSVEDFGVGNIIVVGSTLSDQGIGWHLNLF